MCYGLKHYSFTGYREQNNKHDTNQTHWYTVAHSQYERYIHFQSLQSLSMKKIKGEMRLQVQSQTQQQMTEKS